MLGFLQGKIVSRNADTSACILLCHRVGYELTVPRHVFETLQVGDKTALWVHTHVREDALTLYGFSTESEKHFFRVLLSASGVGPKVAMALLTEHGPERLAQSIVHKEIDVISEAPGVGKKLAQKLVLELSSKVEKLMLSLSLGFAPKTVTRVPRVEDVPPERQLKDELASALQNLSFHPTQVKTVLDRLFAQDELAARGFESVLKAALQELGGRATRVNAADAAEATTSG
jgi:Holliday junction DNA helicase RuvA